MLFHVHYPVSNLVPQPCEGFNIELRSQLLLAIIAIFRPRHDLRDPEDRFEVEGLKKVRSSRFGVRGSGVKETSGEKYR